MESKSTNTLKARIDVLSSIIVELLLPLCIALLAMPFAINIIGGFTVMILLPTLLALLLRAKPVKERRLDFYLASLATLVVFSFVYWLPSIIFTAALCALFYVLIVMKRVAHARILFIGLSFPASLLVSLSGATPLGGKLLTFVALSAFSIIVGLILYALIIGKDRFSARPTIALTVAMLSLTFCSFSLYQTGGRTGWLTGLVAGQTGVELLSPPTTDYLTPRAVVPVKDGLLMYNNMDEFLMLRDRKLEVFLSKVFIGRAISFICDPDDKTICYMPANKKGIAIVNTATRQITKTEFQPRDYALIIADEKMQYIAVLEDPGAKNSSGHIVVAKRTAPGELIEIAELQLKALSPDIFFVNFLAFAGQNLFLTAKAKDKKIIGFIFDVETQNLYKFMEAKDVSGGHWWWHSAVADWEFIILPVSTGKIHMLNMAGKRVKSAYILPLLRHVIYDSQRKLCYLVSDIGFLIIFDPYRARTLRTIFLGFKTKTAYQEGDYIYIGSSAGVFRIDINKALRD